MRSVIAKTLPPLIRTALFGLRKESSVPFSDQDPDWIAWKSAYLHFYSETQTSGLGGVLTRAGYRGVRKINLRGMWVLEIGPGSLPHRRFWQGSPEKFISVEVDEQFHQLAREKCQSDFYGLTRRRGDHRLDLPDESVDVILSFYSLEHLEGLEKNVAEISRVLKPGGVLIGAVPNEGGLLWGLGRFLTTRRWIKKKYSFNYDKIIAWEHPNFVDDIRIALRSKMVEEEWRQIPFPGLGSYNLNLISRFRFTKRR